MKKVFLFALVVLLIKYSSAQLDKHTLLIGGTGLYSSTSLNYPGNTTIRQTLFNLSPNIGYFVLNKFAVGLKPGYSNSQQKGLPSTYKDINLSIGPFIRYYFLPENKAFNILVDGSWQYTFEKESVYVSSEEFTNRRKNQFSIAAGPVLFLNPSVGLEFLVGYSTSENNADDIKFNTVQLGLGLQVHLGKKK